MFPRMMIYIIAPWYEVYRTRTLALYIVKGCETLSLLEVGSPRFGGARHLSHSNLPARLLVAEGLTPTITVDPREKPSRDEPPFVLLNAPIRRHPGWPARLWSMLEFLLSYDVGQGQHSGPPD
jgi:hypothetical protein